MKKMYTLVMAIAINCIATAQFDNYDVRVEYVSYSEGDVIPIDTPFDLQFRIINVGELAIPAEIPLKMGWNINGVEHNSLLALGFDYLVVLEDFEPGDTLIDGLMAVDLPFFAVNKEICCVFYGLSDATPPEISDLDLNVSDNSMCVFYGDIDEPIDSTASIISENELNLEKCYVANSTLVIQLSNNNLNHNSKLALWSADGKLVYDSMLSWEGNITQLNLPNVGSGLYILNLEIDGLLFNRKIKI